MHVYHDLQSKETPVLRVREDRDSMSADAFVNKNKLQIFAII